MSLPARSRSASASAEAGARLDRHLAAIYGERVLRRAAARGAQAALAAALTADGALRRAAEARLAALQEIPEQRCFVSARHREFLEAALALADHP
ncbi:MAG: hypothetical protein ACLQJR_07640 [Stellaceae bacterium]